MNASEWLEQAERVDVAVFAAIAHTETPALDDAMRQVSGAANYSRIWMAVAGLLALVGGSRGRRAAADGLASIAVSATVANLVVKPLSRRRRPERETPLARHLPMPTTRSFPSGHAASAFAFATGVARTQPQVAVPLGLMAATVGYSRIHTGVHYPGDVLAGSMLGTSLAQLTTWARDRRRS